MKTTLFFTHINPVLSYPVFRLRQTQRNAAWYVQWRYEDAVLCSEKRVEMRVDMEEFFILTSFRWTFSALHPITMIEKEQLYCLFGSNFSSNSISSTAISQRKMKITFFLVSHCKHIVLSVYESYNHITPPFCSLFEFDTTQQLLTCSYKAQSCSFLMCYVSSDGTPSV